MVVLGLRVPGPKRIQLEVFFPSHRNLSDKTKALLHGFTAMSSTASCLTYGTYTASQESLF